MRAVIQRVSEVRVEIEGVIHSNIGKGALVFVGIEEADSDEDVSWLVKKIVNLRIFNDQFDVMNLSLLDVDGDVLVVSQFTLHARTKKGNRPSYVDAARPELSIPLYKAFIRAVSGELGKPVASGRFGADMKVFLVNDGPVTIIIDTKNRI